MLSLSRTWFTTVFCLSYILIFSFDWPLFLYYPQAKHIHFGAVATEPGPAMHWYGLVASAAIAGGIAGLLCKDRWLPESLRPWLWLAPVAAMTGSVILLRQFFL